MSSHVAGPSRLLRDETDWRLIGLLREDGRASYESLARGVGLSKVATRARVLKLIASGSVRIAGVAHPSLLGMSHAARVSLDTDGPSLPIARQIAETIPGAVFVALSTGPRAIVAELRMESLDGINQSVLALRALSNVTASETAIYTEIFRDANMALDRALTIKLDKADARIVELLQRDGRMPFVELASLVGLSAASIRTRTIRLIESGAVSIQTLVTGSSDGPERLAGFALDVRYDRGFTPRSVLEVEGVTFLAGSFGSSDLFGTMQVDSLAQVADVTELLRAVAGVTMVRSWIHFQIVKEDYNRPLAVTF